MAERDPTDRGRGRLRRRTYEILEVAETGDWLSRVCDIGLILLILVNVAAVILETVDTLQAAYRDAFETFELISVAIFTVEYLLRAWSAVERPQASKSGKGHLGEPQAILVVAKKF